MTDQVLRPRSVRLAAPLLAAGAFLLAAITLPGCGRGPKEDVRQVVRISQRNEPADLDPATASLPDEFFIIRALSEGLLVPNPKGGEPLPAAADRFDVSEDGLTYTFHLRPATWSNGEPVTAADFVDSFRRVLTPGTASPKAHHFFAVRNARAYATGEVTDPSRLGFTAQDERTLVITLEQPRPGFPHYVASGPWIPVNPRVVARHGRRWTRPEHFVGNGPFVLSDWRPQQHIVVKRNPRYHSADAVALAAIQFLRFDNKDAEERAYRAGQVDVTMAVPESKLDVYQRERPDELHRLPLAETRFLSFNTRRAPLSDAKVRRALSLAIDREQIVARVLRGGQVPATRYLSPALTGRPATQSAVVDKPKLPSGLHEHGFDPARARELLAEAGFPGGRGFPRLEFTGWGNNPALEAVQQMWKQELGIDVGIVTHEAKVHLAALHAGNYDIAFVTNLLDVPDPVAALADFVDGAPNNFPHWTSQAYADRLDVAAREPDLGRAHAALLEAESLLLESAAIAPLYFNAQNWLMSPRVQRWEQDPLWSRRYVSLRRR